MRSPEEKAREGTAFEIIERVENRLGRRLPVAVRIAFAHEIAEALKNRAPASLASSERDPGEATP